MRDTGEWFVEVFEATYADLVRFAARRTEPQRAEEIAAEAFAVAWRRSADLPRELGDARAWLFGIARNLLMASNRRDLALRVRVCDPTDLDAAEVGHEDAVVSSVDLARAWARLNGLHQEALSLTVWEDLTGAQAAAVLGISPVAYRIRLSRARRALALLAGATSTPRPRHEPLALVERGPIHEC